MAEGEFDPDLYYIPGRYQGRPSAGQRVWKWFQFIFRGHKITYIVATILMGAIGWLAQALWAPLAFILVFWAMRKVLDRLGGGTPLIVIETRVQGEVITHVDLVDRPIYVPTGYCKIHIVPASRKKDLIEYGDTTPPVQVNHIKFVDYFEEMEDGRILAVYPKDTNFGNFAWAARANPELAADLRAIGAVRRANMEFRDAVIDAFHDGKLGDGMAGRQKLARLLGEVAQVENHLAATPAGMRKLHLRYKDEIPRVRMESLMLEQDVSRIASAETARALHIVFDHPMSEEIHERIESMLRHRPTADYEKHVQDLVARDFDPDPPVNQDPSRGETRRHQ